MAEFTPWAMDALQAAMGCLRKPDFSDGLGDGLADLEVVDMTSCCDQHDRCYASCGMTQRFCDEQLRSCLIEPVSAPTSVTQRAISNYELLVSRHH